MEYFIMKTDKRYFNLPQIQLPKKLLGIGTGKEKWEDIDKVSVLYVKKSHGLCIDYADYLERPFPLAAEKFHNIMQKYQKDMVFHRITLIERETGKQKPYYFIMPPEIICADKEESVYDSAGNIKDFVLDVKKAGNRKIFIAGDYRKQLIVRLDVAESILRRDADGIWFEPVKIGRKE